MGLFSSSGLKNAALSIGGGLFQSYTGVALTPSGSAPVQAKLPATKTGTPAQDPIVQNGLRTSGGTGGLFGGLSTGQLMLGGVAAAAIVVALILAVRR